MNLVLRYAVLAAGCCLISACASIDYNTADDDDLLYFEPKPVLLVTNTADCKQQVSVLTIPATARRMRFKPGYGSSEMNVTLTNGMIGAVSQSVDLKLPETLGLLTARALDKESVCEEGSFMYEIVGGNVLKDPVFDVPPPKRVVTRK